MRLRYIKLRCPEQNGKVERSHRVDDEEFWSRSTFTGFAPPADALLTWERRYNHERFSMALNGLTPAEKLATFMAAASPGSSLMVPPSPPPSLSSTMDRRRSRVLSQMGEPFFLTPTTEPQGAVLDKPLHHWLITTSATVPQSATPRKPSRH